MKHKNTEREVTGPGNGHEEPGAREQDVNGSAPQFLFKISCLSNFSPQDVNTKEKGSQPPLP
jgi:hypothetical protein